MQQYLFNNGTSIYVAHNLNISYGLANICSTQSKHILWFSKYNTFISLGCFGVTMVGRQCM